MCRVLRYAVYRTNGDALRLVKMPYAFGAQVGVDLVKILAHADGLIGALRLAHIAVDALASDFQGHSFLCLRRLLLRLQGRQNGRSDQLRYIPA